MSLYRELQIYIATSRMLLYNTSCNLVINILSTDCVLLRPPRLAFATCGRRLSVLFKYKVETNKN